MRAGDDPRDINPKATMENTFLPSDVLEYYKGSFSNYTGTAIVVFYQFRIFTHVPLYSAENQPTN